MKRISWRRGMRLTDDLLRASDDCTMDIIREVALMYSAGLFGLLPSEHPFEVNLNFGKGCIDIDSLNCRAISRNGTLIDAHFDTRFDNNYATRVMIPDIPGAEEFLLVVEAVPNQWKCTPDGFEEPAYAFSLIGADTVVPDNGVPIARIVDDYGWRMDEIDFVPPCLLVSVHPKFNEQLLRFADLLSAMEVKARVAIGSAVHGAVAVFWPAVQQLRIAIDKKRDILSPMELLGYIQQCVSAFACACELYPELAFPELKMFRSFVLAPYTVKEAYTRIRIGLEICNSIVEKVGGWASLSAPKQEPKQAQPQPQAPGRPAAPAIDDKYTQILCNTSETTIPIVYSGTSVSIHFTTDGTIPTKKSAMAPRFRNGFRIKFDNGFRQENRQDVEKTITLNLIAIDGNNSSNVVSYSINLKKDLKFRNAIPI